METLQAFERLSSRASLPMQAFAQGAQLRILPKLTAAHAFVELTM